MNLLNDRRSTISDMSIYQLTPSTIPLPNEPFQNPPKKKLKKKAGARVDICQRVPSRNNSQSSSHSKNRTIRKHLRKRLRMNEFSVKQVP